MKDTVGRLFAGELDRSDLLLADGAEGDRSLLLTPTGLALGRLTIAGALTEVEGTGGDYLHARVADPTGVFSLTSGWHRPEVTTALARIEPPAFVAVTASPRLPARAGSRAVLLPEAVAEVDRAARDTWVLVTAEATLGRLERLGAALAGRERDPSLDPVISHYRVTPALLGEFAGMIGDALSTVSGKAAGTPGKDPKELVMAILSARPGEGIPVEDLLAELGRQGISAEEGTRAVNELLAEGECYMPRKGSVRLA